MRESKIFFAAAFILLALARFTAGEAKDTVDPDRYDNLVNASFTGTNGITLRAHLARPDGRGPFPAVIMIHEWWGLRPDIVSKAKALSEKGYVVAAVDVYRGKNTTTVPGALALVASSKKENILADLDAAYRWLASLPEVLPGKIGITGFCFGGTWTLNYSLINPRIAAAAVFYGSGITTEAEALKKLKAPLLGIFGEKDASIPMEKVAAFSNALALNGIENEIRVYPGEKHAFVKGYESILTNENQKDAWNRLLRFFGRNLKPKR